MKIASIIIVVATAIMAGAWVFHYVNQPDGPPCNGNILATSNIAGCDITGATK